MDAITLLKDDHRTVEKLFRRFEEAGDRAYVEKRKLVDRIIEELSIHAAVEEQLFYPVTRATVPAVEDTALESLEEHHIVKWTLSELEGMDPADERFDAKVTVLIEHVRHHVEEEEQEFFPEVRSELGRTTLADLGDAMAEAREAAPLRPHPRSPDTPPGNVVTGTVAGIVDRVRATVSGVAQGGVTAAQDVAGRVLGHDTRHSGPSGPRRARETATTVRQGGNESVDRLIAMAREAKAGAARTAGEARSGAGQVVSDAASGARDAAGAARSGAAKAAADVKDAATRAASDARTGARKATGDAQARAGRTAGSAKATARKTADAAAGKGS
jgi:hemerythrin-like domain-containing protein